MVWGPRTVTLPASSTTTPEGAEEAVTTAISYQLKINGV